MNIKKIIVFTVLSSLLSLPLLTLTQPLGVLAQEAAPGTAPDTVPGDVDVLEVLENLVDWVFTILLIFAALMIVVAGFYFVTAQGNPDQVIKARNFVLWALVGVLVAFLARGLVKLVDSIVG